ncbi:MAG: GNAT family N-acetyltransferase [Calditrichaceae bacterium]|nr:GNAT family N-acetyltransferase [Calditrichaceae bacterium]MBN2708733.1 GNAT family N-acetyltransferase [Calditrichaceae bacterium]RQV97100.1 MAG: GNAT family N-acetyltransferase [Calditrichota bacterium]
MHIIEKFKDTDKEWWDSYVDESDNGTIFHTRKFLSYHPAERFKDHSLIFKQKNSIRGIFPAITWMMDKEKVLYSHRGASYGGFVYRDAGIRDAFDLVESLKRYAKEEGFNRIIITLPPIVYMTRYSNYLDFAMIQNGFRYLKREISSVLQLPSEKNDIFNLFKSEARTATRKSMKKNITIKLSDDYDSYYKILKENLMLRHNVTPTHTLEEIKRLQSLFPDKIHLWGAFLGDTMIAGVVNFICTKDVILAFYISDDKTYQEYRSVNNLFYHIFQWAVQENYKFYDFGIFTVNMDPNWGLGKFKESFGARGLFRDTFELLL